MDKMYYGIGEVATELGVNASTLRFWETEFKWIKPHKNARGVRLYTTDDITLLKRIIYLTRDLGYTLEGAREQIKMDRHESNTLARQGSFDENVIMQNSLLELRQFLVNLKEEL